MMNNMDKRRKPKSIDDVFFRNPDVMSRLSIDSPEALVGALGDQYIPAKRDDLFEKLPDKDRRFLTDYYYRYCDAGMDRQPACLEVVITFAHNRVWMTKEQDFLIRYEAIFDRIANTFSCQGKTHSGKEINIHSILDEKKGDALFSCAELWRGKSDKIRDYLDADHIIVHCEYADGFSCDFDPYQIKSFGEYSSETTRSLSRIMEDVPFQKLI